MTTLLDVRNVTMTFGGITALDDLTFDVRDGEILGLIGPNGAGKTTMFNVISGVYRPSSGAVLMDGVNLVDRAVHNMPRLGITRTFQNLALWPGMTVLENVMLGAHTRGRQNFFTAPLGWRRRAEEKALAAMAWDVIDELGLADVAQQECDGLPYGTLKRIELARALAGSPKLLLLDEPATGLTHSEVADLVSLIRRVREQRGCAILLVEHHMGMVMSLSDRIVVVDLGARIAEGLPAEVRANPRVIEAYLGESQ